MQSLTLFLRRSTFLRQSGKTLDRGIRKALCALLDLVLPAPVQRGIPDAQDIRSILLVRANFRIGNVVLATAMLPMLQERFPQARIDFLVGDKPSALLDGQPLRRVHLISRRFIYAPWRFVILFRGLRRERFDLAVDGGMGSFSGAVFSWLSGARHRIGADGRYGRFLTTRLSLPVSTNVYDSIRALGDALGTGAQTRSSYHVSPGESAQAAAWLQEAGMLRGGRARPLLGMFVGGNLEKRWPRRHWLDLIGQLDRHKVQTLVFVGPDEMHMLAALQARAGSTVRIVAPQPLRAFAGLLAHTTLLLTPDSGPMHLAAAMGIPVLTIVQTESSRFYVPLGEDNRILMQPDAAAVMQVLQSHPVWDKFAASWSGPNRVELSDGEVADSNAPVAAIWPDRLSQS